MQRKTVNFGGSSASEVAPFLEQGTSERAALANLVGEDLGSESDVLRALVRVGLRFVRDYQLEQGYAEMAAAGDEEDRLWADASMRFAAERCQRES